MSINYSAHEIPYLVLSFVTAVLLVSAFTTNKSSLAPCSEFKVAMLTFKILATFQPTYFYDTLLVLCARAFFIVSYLILSLPTSNFFKFHT